MKFSESLKKNKDFQLVYKTGLSYANRDFVMYIRNNDLEMNRVGISVSKKVGNSIVRHRITRLVREIYRLQEEKVRCGLDIIVIGRISCKDKNYHTLKKSFIHLCKLHGIYSQDDYNEKNVNHID